MKQVTYILLILILSSLNAFSQKDGLEAGNCNIDGVVVNVATQNPLPGVTAQLVGTKLGAISNAAGRFIIKDVPAGVYSVRFTYVGYQPYVEANLSFNCGKPLSLRI
jgi:hypothetical protein